MEYQIGAKVIDGGEGIIYEVQDRSDLLIKIYKQNDNQGNIIVTRDLAEKLEYMKSNPPGQLASQGCIAWPIDIAYKDGKLIGFVMPRLKIDSTILQIYAYKNPLYDAKSYDNFPSVKSRIMIAINLVSIVNELHKNGYIVGDLNHENLGVNKKTGQINVVDCDSFHIIDSKGVTYRTKVAMPGYLAPEIIRHCQEERAAYRPYKINEVILPTFSIESDLFCLAKHIFKLLMNGVDPFTGIIENTKGSTAAPFQGNEAVERNAYIFKPGYYSNSAFCPEANEIPAYILGLFQRAFIDGHANPSSRPNVHEWHNALMRYLNSLCQCSVNIKHQYLNTLSACPFCKADKRHESVQAKNGMPPPKGNITPPDNASQPVNIDEGKLFSNTELVFLGITAFVVFIIIFSAIF